MYSMDRRSTEGACANPIPNRPRRSHSGRNGRSTSMSSAPTEGMFTAVETTPPVSAATTCSAVWMPARSCASAVEAPR